MQIDKFPINKTSGKNNLKIEKLALKCKCKKKNVLIELFNERIKILFLRCSEIL